MTFEQLIAKARDITTSGPGSSCASDLAIGVLDLLAEAQPCGWDAPQVLGNARVLERVGVPNQWATDWVTAEDARAFARMLLAAADEADQRTKEHAK